MTALGAILSGSQLMDMDFTDEKLPTARQLLESGECHPACLLANEDARNACLCRCNERYHGTLLDARISYDDADVSTTP